MHNASRNSIARAVVLALCCLLSTPVVARAQANDRVGQLQRAAANIAGDRLAEAERQLNQILKETPEEATALNLLGALRAKQGRLEEAEALFTRAVRSDERLVGAH